MTDQVASGAVAPATAAPPAERNFTILLLGFAGLVIGQFMAILDIQIVASSLLQIQAGVGASADEIAWVQTIYLLAEVVIMPLTAYMTRMWGTQRFYMVAAAAFAGTSVLTGLTTDIDQMIVMRAVQGLAAGAMIPPVFAVAMTAFPPDKRIMANVATGLIVTLAPTIGPTLGGHLTDALGWRWLFFVNVPPAILAIFLVARYGDFDRPDPNLGKGVDWWGVGLMAVALLSLQYAIEEGAKNSWFQDDVILWLTVLGTVTLLVFVYRQLTIERPIISLKPFGDRNFALGSIMNLMSGASLFGGTFVLPLYLGQVRQYSSSEVGTTMVVGGATMFLMGPITGRLLRAIDPRICIFVGFLIVAYGMSLGTHLTKDWGFWEFASLQAFRGVGTMIAMIGAQTLSVSTIPVTLMKDASALVNLIRNIGGAIGLAVLSTEITHKRVEHYSDITERVNAANVQAQGMMAGLTERMMALGTSDPAGAARKAMSFMMQREAAVLAFSDAFLLLTYGCAAAAFVAVFAKKPPPMGGPPAGGH